MAYTPDANNTAEPISGRPAGTAAAEFRALKQKIASVIAGAVVTTGAGATPADLTTYVVPDINDRPAMVAGGWLPWNLNQQWGGAPMPFHMIDGATGTEYKFDAFDAYIDDKNNSDQDLGSAATGFYVYQAFTPAKNLSLQAIWIKACKVANPTDNLTLKLWSVAAGVPNAVIATANTINGKQITSDVNCQWYRFSFAVVQALVANTQYIWTLEKSGGVDAVNFYRIPLKATTRYPSNLHGIGTAVPAWTTQNTFSSPFICEAQVSDQVIQSNGTFNGRIIGSEGNPINRSVGYIKPLREFFPLFNSNGWSILLRGKSWTKDKTIAELIYGLHHDRINIRSAAATGFVTVTAYESDNTVTTVTGTSDVSTAAFKDILIVGRSLNDGADYIKIYTGINNVWTKEAESLGLSLIFDPLMLKQGHMWIMGGFPLWNNTNYTKFTDMSVLPSADGWTYVSGSGAVEGARYSVFNGKLNQIKAGAGGDDYLYRKTAAGFSNVNGWLATVRVQVISSSNDKDRPPVELKVEDGTKVAELNMQEYWLQNRQAANNTYPQVDLKSALNTVIFSGKGSDALVFVNGKFVSDSTGIITTASANNQISFGDEDNNAGENADALWDYIGYYNTSNIYPQFTSGELHELGVWSGDKNSLGQALYNLGVPLSIKQYCGLKRNYAEKTINITTVTGINVGASTTQNNPPVVIVDSEFFVLGNELELHLATTTNETATANGFTDIFVDSNRANPNQFSSGNTLNSGGTAAGEMDGLGLHYMKKYNYGLHKIDQRIAANGAVSFQRVNKATLLTCKFSAGA